MNFFRQIFAVTAMNIAGIPQRLGSASVVVVGIGGVVGVLISVLALTTGMSQVMTGGARADRAFVLSQGAFNPTNSNIARADVLTIMEAPGIKKDADGKPLAAALTLIPMELRTKAGKRANVPVLGVSAGYFGVHPEVRIIEGRMFRPAVNELIVGKSAQLHYANLNVGDHFTNRNGEWTVVGVYESAGDTMESYLTGDIDVLMSAFRRTTVQDVNVVLTSPDALKEFADGIAANPALKVEVKRESEFLANLSKQINTLLGTISYGIGGIMAVGAMFGALNTMYSAVSARTLEIATLRAIGFGGTPVVISVVVESLLLALTGAIVGALAAWVFFNGNSVSSSLAGAPIQSTMTVSPNLIALGVLWALAIGLIGGLFPAIRAARLPVALALQVR
jgi:putative ABC transport system permease protein